MNPKNIRNFAIIAHIDHGKSTLADRLLEMTGAVSNTSVKNQVLDTMDLERERGITIKLKAVSLTYKLGSEKYYLNLIDTPGHVDFAYEVSRSLAACESAVLVVDATQGVEAQTIAHLNLARAHQLAIIPVINKIDLPKADGLRVQKQLVDYFGFQASDIIFCSAKTGTGIRSLIERIIKVTPPPLLVNGEPTKALIFDSYYDPYKGVVLWIKVVSGCLQPKAKIKMMATENTFEIAHLGINTPQAKIVTQLSCGQVGWLDANIHNINQVAVGDTITLVNHPATKAIVGYQKIKPMIYAGVFPLEPNRYEELKAALAKLKLNDSALLIEPETKSALGFGFRVGFLGLLHLDIIKARIQREFKLDLIVTSPSVVYRVYLTNNKMIEIENPSQLPERHLIKEIQEPYLNINILIPNEAIGSVMKLAQNKRGIYQTMEWLDPTQVNLHYEIPLAEIICDFYDKLKSYTQGYASLDYEMSGYRPANLVKLDIYLNGVVVDALSIIVPHQTAYNRARTIVTQLATLIPRQMFQIPIQACLGSKVIARENIKALSKNVLAKCYGGDLTRKKKLLAKQKEGKKRLKMVGRVAVPPEVFWTILANEENSHD